MDKTRQRKMEHGRIHNGRLELDRQTREVIRAFTKYLLSLWEVEEKRALAADDRMKTVQSAGVLRRANTICEVLETLMERGQWTLDPVTWMTCWTWATTDDRHRVKSKPQPAQSLPMLG